MSVRPARQDAEGVESLLYSLLMDRMSTEGEPDRDELSAMKVSELRQMCSDQGLLVSGKKDDLINRLLGVETSGKEVAEKADPAAENLDDAIDKMLARVRGEGTEEPETEPESEPEDEVEEEEAWYSETEKAIEEEVIEAEIIEPEPEPETEPEPELEEDPEDDPWFSGVIASEDSELVLDYDEEEEDEPSVVINLPSVAGFKENWQIAAAVGIVVLLVGAAAVYLIQPDPAFTARPLRYGDQMDFTVSATSVAVTGEEMVGYIRDATSPTLDLVCSELRATVSGGTGTISLRRGDSDEIFHSTDSELEGTVMALDAYGRQRLTVEQTLTFDLSVDLEGKLRDEGDCTGWGWDREDNTLVSNSKSWRDITTRSTVRTDTQVNLIDSDGVTTTARAVVFGADELGSVGDLASLLLFPLTPIELHAFFGDTQLTKGLSSNDDIKWDSDWRWSVGSEINTDDHGLVTQVSIFHYEIGRCLGHAHIDILVKSGNPWPVKQEVDIVIDKTLEGPNCNFVGSSLNEVLPDGSISIEATLTETSSNTGSQAAHWGYSYAGSPGSGEDVPGGQTQWGYAMPDHSDQRDFDLEAAVDCLMLNHSATDAAVALETGGYVWQAAYSTDEWNLSWVGDDDAAGWIILGARESGGCNLVDQDDYDEGTTVWSRDSIPDTLTLEKLEQRVLADERYPDLETYMSSSRGNWEESVSYGYLLSVSEANDVLSSLPVDVGDGQVNVAGSRTWQDSGREHTVSFAMNAESSKMVAWYHTSVSL